MVYGLQYTHDEIIMSLLLWVGVCGCFKITKFIIINYDADFSIFRLDQTVFVDEKDVSKKEKLIRT